MNSILPIGEASPIKTKTIDAFDGYDGSSMSLSDIFSKEVSKIAGDVKITDTNADKLASKGSFMNPLDVMAMQKEVDKGLVTANLVATVVSKIPKGLEILNK
jgi:hypothetical protein